jgi:hypothetical protein
MVPLKKQKHKTNEKKKRGTSLFTGCGVEGRLQAPFKVEGRCSWLYENST